MNSRIIVIVFAIVGQFQVEAHGPSVLKRTSSPCLQSPCENNGQCYNTVEGYQCQCPEGYSGKRCEILKCIDSDLEQCPLWAKEGECFKNPSWMLENCKKSCRIEACGCTDERKECAAWAKQGECQKNPRYMMKFCRRSCGGCKQSRKPNVLR